MARFSIAGYRDRIEADRVPVAGENIVIWDEGKGLAHGTYKVKLVSWAIGPGFGEAHLLVDPVDDLTV